MAAASEQEGGRKRQRSTGKGSARGRGRQAPVGRSVAVRGQLLRDFRHARGWTQRDAATRCGVSDRSIRAAERGGPISRRMLHQLALAYEMPAQALIKQGVQPRTGTSMAPRAREFLEQIWNHGNLAVVDTHLAPEFRFHHEAGVVTSRAEMRERITQFRSSFSDFCFTVEDVHEYGEFVVCRWTVQMTHTGPWVDLPPTHCRVTVHGSSWVQVVDGLFGDAWDYWDARALYESLQASLPVPPRKRRRAKR